MTDRWEATEDDWEIVRGVTCVVCPACGFTFDAVHEDVGGGYSCPTCTPDYREMAERAEASRQAQAIYLGMVTERLQLERQVSDALAEQLRECLVHVDHPMLRPRIEEALAGWDRLRKEVAAWPAS